MWNHDVQFICWCPASTLFSHLFTFSIYSQWMKFQKLSMKWNLYQQMTIIAKMCSFHKNSHYNWMTVKLPDLNVVIAELLMILLLHVFFYLSFYFLTIWTDSRIGLRKYIHIWQVDKPVHWFDAFYMALLLSSKVVLYFLYKILITSSMKKGMKSKREKIKYKIVN